MKIEFFIPMIPPTKTHQQKKIHVVNGKPITYEPQELKNIRLKLLTLVAPHKPIAPMVEPVQLITKWLYPAKGKHKNGDYKTTKPDTDNMIKLLKDCMTLVGYWKDDAYVVSEITEKFYANKPGIYICVRSLNNDNS